MSEYKPKAGDHVRVVLDGYWMDEPESRSKRDFAMTATLPGYTFMDRRKIISVEQVSDPIPTTVGSLIRLRGPGGLDGLRRLTRSGKWRAVDDGTDVTDYVESYPDEYDIAFDAGAQ